MKMFRLAVAAAALSTGLSAAQQPGNLQATLAKLDATSAKFSNAQASFHKDLYNALVKEHTPQDGTVYFQRTRSGTDFGARIDGAGARVVEYKNQVLRDYNPAIKCFDTVQSSGHQSTIESFFALGFGGSGKDLAKNWTVTDLGPQTLSDDGRQVKVEKLNIVPIDKSIANNFTHIELWLDLDRGVSLKQVAYTPSGDVQTATYSKIRLNERSVDTKPFEIKGKPCGK